MGFEVAYDPGQNIKIVKAVQKYPVLYNTRKYPPIEYRGSSEQAWALVAEELGVSEGYCRNRWTNIKGCFKRYLRNKAQSNSTKTYYLADYLKFMLPFMNIKRIRDQKNDQHEMESGDRGDEADVSNDFELKLVDSDGEEESFFISTNSNSSDDVEEPEPGSNADWDFFSSLLPDVQKMNAEQKSKFKNSLLTAIDTALYGEDF